MKSDFDLYFKKMRSLPNEDEHMALLAVLPPIGMLLKLMNRKQSGKKPFSDTFDFEGKIDEMMKAKALIEEELVKKEIDKEACKKALRSLNEIALSAEKEIKLASLKGDYCYLASVFEDSYIFLG